MGRIVSVRQYTRGHEVISYDNGKTYFYSDTKEPANYERPCKRCGLFAEHNEPDPCLGVLPDVEFACCGHGVEGQDYVYIYGKRLSLDEYNKRYGKI